MKKKVLLSVIIGALPLIAMAQDDLYFTPKKSVKEVKSSVEKLDDSPTYYSGSQRSDDDYNRLGEFASHYEKVGTDSLGNDIIEFHPGKGYAEEADEYQYDEEDDYTYSRRMSRFEDMYIPYDPWFYTHYGFGPYWRSHYFWSGYYPWYDGWYGPWYGGWYDPWYPYYGWYNSWYSPWYYGYWGWGYPYHYGYWGGYGGGGIAHVDTGRSHGITGTSGHGHVYRPGRGGYGSGNFSGARGGNNGTRSVAGKNGKTSRQSGKFGGNRSGTRYTWSVPSRSDRSDVINGTTTVGGGARTTGTYGGSYSRGSFGGGHSSGSFGGGGGSTRSSGGGGSRGGGFGGRR